MEYRFVTCLATLSDREQIYRIRHEVYAEELGQHLRNADGILRDTLDGENEYIVVREHDRVVAFISITPPSAKSFSIDKYFSRSELPVCFHDRLYELRLLTVIESRRNTVVLPMLVRASFDYLLAKGATEVIAIGRRELLPMYEGIGFERLGFTTTSGRVVYELMRIDEQSFRNKSELILSERSKPGRIALKKIPQDSDSLYEKAYHGGAFFEAIGDRFDSLERKDDVINADVLDAWFDPAPEISEKISRFLPWEIKTSPPTHAEGVLATLAESRRIQKRHFVLGAGSSDLMFRAIRLWVTKSSRVLILDPSYGEYGHILENVIGCEVHKFKLSQNDGYSINLSSLLYEFSKGYDWIFLVNPNSPTGTVLPYEALASLFETMHPKTHVWVDETYIDYVDPSITLEPLAVKRDRIVICKSLSKCYALSGVRAAYLCGSGALMAQIRHITPPWVLGLPTQIAVVFALRNGKYYEQRWSETRRLREQLAAALDEVGIDVINSQANFILCKVRGKLITAKNLIERCRRKNLFLRDLSNFGGQIDEFTFRISVKSEYTNRQMIKIISEEISAVQSNIKFEHESL